MAKAKRRVRYQFTVEVKGTKYDCERVVEGTRILNQEITVNGVGSKSDPARYGEGQYPVRSMEGIAKLIAGEIIAGV
jgi:hypothetical protein